MSKLLRLKHWVTLPDAARHLSAMFDEAVDVVDVLQLGLDRRLALSVCLDNPVRVQPMKAIPEAEADRVPGLPVPGKPPYEVTLGIQLGDGMVLVEDGPHAQAQGLYDLAMLGGERLEVERRCREAQGLTPRDVIAVDGTFIKGKDSSMLRVLEPLDDYFIPAPALPDGAHIVVRTDELLALASGATTDASASLAEAEGAQGMQSADLARIDQDRKEAEAQKQWQRLLAELDDIKATHVSEQEKLRAAATEYEEQTHALIHARDEMRQREQQENELTRTLADSLTHIKEAHAEALRELQAQRDSFAVLEVEHQKIKKKSEELSARVALEQTRRVQAESRSTRVAAEEFRLKLANEEMRQELNALKAAHRVQTSPEGERRSSEPRRKNEMGTRERDTLLTMIAALSRKAGITPTERGAATAIARATDDAGTPVSDDTVRSVLQRLPDALANRSR